MSKPEGSFTTTQGATRFGLSMLGMALVLGIVGEALLRVTPWGVNIVLWVGALFSAGGSLAYWRPLALTGEGRWFVWPALFFAAAFAWRDSVLLLSINGLALLAALTLVALRARTGQVHCASIMEYGLGTAQVLGQALLGCYVLLAADVRWQELSHGTWVEPVKAVGRGVIIALPLLLVFGGLFVAADAVFEGMVTRLFNWVGQELVTHIFWIGVLTWVSGGFLRQALLAQEWAAPTGARPAVLSLSIIEVGVVLGLLDLLFLTFVLVQVRYFFGGADMVVASTGLTYAEYARRGFFELVAVAALVLPLLLLAHWLLRRENPAHEPLFRLLAGVLVALLFVIMASAVQRMLLYQAAYGLTELRFYTTAFMGWLAVVLVWFVVTVLRGRREYFAFGAVVTGFMAVALLDGLNPDALIVRTNASRLSAGFPFDAYYVTALSADAVPALAEVLPHLSLEQRHVVARAILRRWSAPVSRDWRTWNWSRTQAWQVVETNRATLQHSASLGESFGHEAEECPTCLANSLSTEQ